MVTLAHLRCKELLLNKEILVQYPLCARMLVQLVPKLPYIYHQDHFMFLLTFYWISGLHFCLWSLILYSEDHCNTDIVQDNRCVMSWLKSGGSAEENNLNLTGFCFLVG